MIMKSFGYVVSIDDNRIIIDCYESNEFLKPRIVGLIKSNITGDEKVKKLHKKAIQISASEVATDGGADMGI